MVETITQFIQQATNGKVFEQGGLNQNLFSKVGQHCENFSLFRLINLYNQLCK